MQSAIGFRGSLVRSVAVRSVKVLLATPSQVDVKLRWAPAAEKTAKLCSPSSAPVCKQIEGLGRSEETMPLNACDLRWDATWRSE